jgi:type III pantothenate kinase
MNLGIDMGNTRTKIAFFDQNDLVQQAIVPQQSLESLLEAVANAPQPIQQAILTSTSRTEETVVEAIRNAFKNAFPIITLQQDTPIPIQNRYKTPKTLGKDRLAAVIGAHFLFPKQNVLVIDAGTCVTYDWISAKGQYFGGNISPGLRMRLQAMHHFTAKLPLIAPPISDLPMDLIGIDTENALRTGASYGLIAEADGMIRRYRKQLGALTTLFTGGDGAFLHQKTLEKKTMYEQNIVLIGLNQILIYNNLL